MKMAGGEEDELVGGIAVAKQRRPLSVYRTPLLDLRLDFPHLL